MTSLILPPGSTGTDTASNRLDYNKSHAAGHTFDSVYVGGWWGATRQMIEAIWRAGNVTQLNFEREDKESAFAEGYAKGKRYALISIDQGKELGWQGESPMVFSFADFNPVDIQNMLNVHRAIPDVYEPLGLVGGAYGPPAFLRILKAQPWWPDHYVMWQWMGAGGKEEWTDVKQTGRGTIGGIAVDFNVTYKPVRFWAGYGPNPVQKVGDMADFRHNSFGAVFQINSGYKVAVTGDYFYGVLGGALNTPGPTGVVSYQADDAKLAAIPDMPNPGGGSGPIPTNINLTGTLS